MKVTVESIPMHYEEFGTGVPVLMLHGWPVDHRHMVADWEPLFAQRSRWRRIYPDLPGMGRTPGASWITHQDQMLEIVIAFMQEIAPGERFIVVGTSYGGYLARGLIHQQDAMIDGACLLIPLVETDTAKQDRPAHQVLREDARFLEALAPEEMDLTDFFVVQSPEALDAFRTNILRAVELADHAFLERLGQNFAFSFPVDQPATRFPAPTLILTGRQDKVCGYREAWAIVENFPRGTFVVLDRAGHGLNVEQPSLFRALAREWLDRVEEYLTPAFT